MSERFSSESIEQDIEALLAVEAEGDDARLARALAGLYSPPAGAGAALERVYARVVHSEGNRPASLESQSRLDSWYGPDNGGGLPPAIEPPAGRERDASIRNPHPVTGIRAALAAVAAVLVVAVITGSFLFAFQSHGRRPGKTARATATTARLLGTSTPLPILGPAAVPVPGVPPAWQTHEVPVQFIQQRSELGFAISPRDGASAYICNPVTMAGGSQLPEIWVTHDRGSQWMHTGNLPLLGQIAECSVDVDAFNSARLVVMLSGDRVDTLAGFVDWFTSSDSGGSWQMVARGTDLATNSVEIQNEALYQGKAYAIYTTVSPLPPSVPTPTPNPNRPGVVPAEVQTHLSVSTDGLHTWQPVDAPILSLTGSKQYVKQFWARVDADGRLDLLADVGTEWHPFTAPPGVDTLWVSHDGGSHWSQLPAPSMAGFIAQVSSDGQSWLICGSSAGSGTGGQVVMACSMDSGTTWAARPALRTCGSCTGISIVTTYSGAYLTSDGSLLQEAEYQTQPILALYRLPPNSSQWQYLGLMPTNENALMYAPAPTSGGVVWTYGGGGTLLGNDLSGIIGGTGTSTGVIYTAAYPR